MKHLSLIFGLCLFFLMTSQMQAQHGHGSHNHDQEMKRGDVKPVNGVTAIFMVYGKCGMCEKRIEGALTNVEGVHSADWGVDTKVMTIKYDDEAISLDEIKKKVAALGHDTDDFRAEKEMYDGLPGCCQYDRPKS